MTIVVVHVVTAYWKLSMLQCLQEHLKLSFHSVGFGLCTHLSPPDTVSVGSKRGPQDRGTGRIRQPMVYHNVAGQVIEADGLKGELGM